jgi:ADP-ribose pyrophosphatase YjhB (NUDIX family)
MSNKIGIRPATITLKENKVLLVKSKYKNKEFFLFPGGGLEFGETIKEGAVRETFEETGIKIKIKKLIHVNEYIYKNDWKKRSINMFFLAEPINKTKINIQTKDKGKIKETLWIDIKDLNKIDVRPKIIAEALKNNFKKKDFSIIPYSIDYKK